MFRVLARSAKPSARLSIRYYFWTDDGPWRISERLHSEIVSGKVELTRYAGTRQKVVEVQIRRVSSRPIFVRARGIYYKFDSQGHLNLPELAEAVGLALEGSRPKRVDLNLFDIGPAVRHRRWLEAQTWQVSSTILRKITADLQPRSRSLDEQRIPFLKQAHKEEA